MLDRAAFEQRLKAAFDGFNRHADFDLLRGALRRLIDIYPTLDENDRYLLGTPLKIDFMETLEKGEPEAKPGQKAPLTRNEKVRVYLEVLSDYPDLMERVNLGLKYTSCRHVFSRAVGIPGIDTMRRYLELKSGLGDYVTKYLSRYVANLPYMCRQLDGTPEAALIVPDVMQDYVYTLADERDSDLPSAWSTLKKLSGPWNMFERAAHDLCIFGAYAPAVSVKDIVQDYEFLGNPYHVLLDEREHIMTIDYIDLDHTHQSGWVEFIEDHQMIGTYILLNHALEVLKGKREGALSQDPDWTKTHKDMLQWALESDVEALGNHIKRQGYKIPYTPQALIPTV